MRFPVVVTILGQEWEAQDRKRLAELERVKDMIREHIDHRDLERLMHDYGYIHLDSMRALLRKYGYMIKKDGSVPDTISPDRCHKLWKIVVSDLQAPEFTDEDLENIGA